MAEAHQLLAVQEPYEAAEAPPSHLLQEDALDGIDRTELQDLFQPWLDRLAHQLNRGTG